MHARLASKDKNKIGKLFTFPIPDSLISLSLSDSSFDEEWKRVGGLSESAFSTWFDEISEEWEFDKFNKIFTYLDVTKLLHKNKLEHKEIVNTEPCYGTYSIEIKDSLVSITCGSNTNDKYKGDLNPEEVTRCEYWVFWTFVFDGRKLRFVRQTAAG